jgi:hypothetical protein
LLKTFISGFISGQQFKSCSPVHIVSHVTVLFVLKDFILLTKIIIFYTSGSLLEAESLSVFYNCDVTHTPSCLPITIHGTNDDQERWMSLDSVGFVADTFHRKDVQQLNCYAELLRILVTYQLIRRKNN